MQFIDPNGTYTGGYTSNMIQPNTSGPNGRGVIQVEITTGTLQIQGRVEEDAPWQIIKTYAATSLEQIVLVPYFRVVASDSAKAWVEETR